LQLEHQLVRLSGRRFTWQLHRTTTPHPKQQQQPLVANNNRKLGGQKIKPTWRRDAPTCTAEIPAQATRAMCVRVYVCVVVSGRGG
jgi:hypothetical protein